MSGLRVVEVRVEDQLLDVFEGDLLLARFPVSTSPLGTGCAEGSLRTPVGRFRIVEAIGEGEPECTIFRSRIPCGVWDPGTGGEDDLVLTRILRLDGLDPWNANTLCRYIYIHGTNQEHLVGVPAGHGCVRLRNRDMIGLFGLVGVGDIVRIHGGAPSFC